MKTLSHQHTGTYGVHSLSNVTFSETMMLRKIGFDLRAQYAELVKRAPPDELLKLAALVDERLALEGSRD